MLAPLMLAGAALAAAPRDTGGTRDTEDGPAELRVAVVGHVRGDADPELLEYLDELLDEVARREPDVVVLTGDLIWGDVNSRTTDLPAVRASWEALDAALERLDAEILRVPGNHDISDRVTRDLWLGRYGEPQRWVDRGGCRLVLLSSAWIPADDDTRKHPPQLIRGEQLDADEVAFVREALESGPGYRHAFLFQHHMLWWEDWADWWRDVHPLLLQHPVRAVFAGDYGPRKFSHLERDGVHYLQASVENEVSLAMLRRNDRARELSAELDTFLLVSVAGDDVRYEVVTVGALTRDQFSPERWRDVHEFDQGTLQRRLYMKWGGGPEKLMRGVLTAGALAGLGGLALGAVLGWLAGRRARGGRG